uniref:Uncharacterized protein n=1 Tax=Populus alba TaxID=43335 RepID=A0A4U5MWM1_POPAL|nr:hypothetical protein D5086_0000297910 [Populus alba]
MEGRRTETGHFWRIWIPEKLDFGIIDKGFGGKVSVGRLSIALFYGFACETLSLLEGFNIQGFADLATRVSKPKGCENRPQRAGLLSRRSGLQTLPRKSVHPRLESLQTPSSQGSDSPTLGLQLGAQVCPQHLRVGRPHTRCLHVRTLTSPSARWLQRGTQVGARGLPNAQA